MYFEQNMPEGADFTHQLSHLFQALEADCCMLYTGSSLLEGGVGVLRCM